MGLWRSFVKPLYSDVKEGIKDIASDVGSATNTLIVDPVKDIVEGGLDLTENTVNTGLKTAGSLLQGDVKGAYSDLSGGVKNVGTILDETYMDIRDPAVAAAVIAGNYILPGSSIITSRLANEGAQDILNSSGGKTFNVAAGASGAYNGNLDNYGFNSSGTAPVDGGTNLFADGAIPGNAAELANYGITDQVTADAVTKAVASGMTVSQAISYVKTGLLINSLAGDPLGLSGNQDTQTGTGSTGFAQVPIPAEWKSPTYAASSAPIDLNSIFSNENMLTGTQWQNLPSQRNMSFNDIFAAGQQETPMGTPVDINQIVSSILGQAATSQKSA